MRYITVEDLSFYYDKEPVLEHINYSVDSGEFVTLTGENGAAKTTLIKASLGILQPRFGKVTISKTNTHGKKLRIAYLPQQIASFNAGFPSTVYEFVKSGRYPRKGWFRRLNAHDEEHIKASLDSVGMWEHRNKRIGSLSGGQKQRAVIARMFASDPDIFVLDEPTTGLDIQTREAIWDLLNLLQEKQKMTVVLTTHYLDEADSADQVYIVDHGQIIAQGTANQIKGKYAKNILKLQTGNIDPLLDYLRDDSLIEKVNEGEIILKPETAQSALDIINDCRDLIDNFEFVLMLALYDVFILLLNF